MFSDIANLIWSLNILCLNRFFYFSLLLFSSCHTRECVDNIENLYVIETNKVLTIEFLESEKIRFYRDTTHLSLVGELTFVKAVPFSRSRITGLKEHLATWLGPLVTDRKLFMLHFEVLYAGRRWLKLRNRKPGFPVLWLKKEPGFSLNSWQVFLSTRNWIKSYNEACNPFFTAPDTGASRVLSDRFGCMQVIKVESEWLVIAYTSMRCQDALKLDRYAFVKWRDSHNRLLLNLNL